MDFEEAGLVCCERKELGKEVGRREETVVKEGRQRGFYSKFCPRR